MRRVEIGTHRFTEVMVTDNPGEGGACHEYVIRPEPINPPDDPSMATTTDFAQISFQNGPVKEKGINGCHQEDLLVIVIDRLQSFQAGKWACRENALALTKIQEAIHWLNHRTQDRVRRGVEGTNTL